MVFIKNYFYLNVFLIVSFFSSSLAFDRDSKVFSFVQTRRGFPEVPRSNSLKGLRKNYKKKDC